MSHFSVLVIGDDITKQLQPYHEYECTGIDDEYVVDVDRTDEARAKYAERSDDYKNESFEEWAEGWYGITPNSDGRVIDRTNPNAKWDWRVIGGRWSTWLPFTEGTRAELDIEAIRAQKADEARADYRSTVPADIEPPDTDWAGFRDRYDTIDEARNAWQNHPFVKACNEAHDGWCWDASEYFVDEETFVEAARMRAIVPFAVVVDGEWLAKGEMGWFGASTEEMPESEWNRKVNELIENLPGETLLTVVDCHI